MGLGVNGDAVESVAVCEYVRGSDFNLEENECYGSNRRQFRRRVRIIRIRTDQQRNWGEEQAL